MVQLILLLTEFTLCMVKVLSQNIVRARQDQPHMIIMLVLYTAYVRRREHAQSVSKWCSGMNLATEYAEKV